MPSICLITYPIHTSHLLHNPKFHSLPSTSPTSFSSFLCSLKPRRFHALRPCSSLKETKKQHTLSQTPSSAPQRFRRLLNFGLKEEDDVTESGAEKSLDEDTAVKGTVFAGLLLIVAVGGFAAASYLYKDQISDLLNQLTVFIEGHGPGGYALFVLVYAALEILAIPAIPLTLTAGLLFGSLTGTIIVSISGTMAASIAFLIARYFARESILKLVEGNKKFLAIDRAIGENSFKIVTLLRLSPLLPFSLGNYLYGLTSVEFVPYVLGSWLGMLPGTWAYVSAGALGRAIIEDGSASALGGGGNGVWTLGFGLLFTVVAAAYVTRLAKDALKDIDT